MRRAAFLVAIALASPALAGPASFEANTLHPSDTAGGYLAGPVSAADYTLYPELALVQRMASRNPGVIPADLAGPNVAAWMQRMATLPIVQRTWPPHWR